MTLIPLAFGLAAMMATLAGGMLALRLRHRIGIVLGVTAGIVVGVALFDLVPEALELAGDRWAVRQLMGFTAMGLAGYMLLDRALARIPRTAAASWRGDLGPAMLCLHSMMDGLGIGLAFQIDTAAGWMIALAVLTHDVADGVNTVSLSLAARSEAAARRWLLLNGAAPMLGVLIGLGISIPASMLAPLMALFAGVFLYIGACELVPRSQSLDPRFRTSIATIAGILLMLGVTHFAH
ncbi:ZIP family metal transporter [Sphingomonas sanguinis]|uniref:ZIP family metal transporter n=1 Tax=Sphingomonas sp. LC-1 TaxID=3110957 RepID=UPI0021BB7F9A|nr:ZIP family metal transporter [Sphingomonas sp. LC-1]MCT8000430.1 ZIP family metal transporter [Sphingomonas sp. LC-1]